MTRCRGLTRRQGRLLAHYADDAETLFRRLVEDDVDAAPVAPARLHQARSVLAQADRLLAGSGLRPATRLPARDTAGAAEIHAALVAASAALVAFIARHPPPPLVAYPRSPPAR